MTCLIEPTAGRVLFKGTDVTKMNAEELRRFRRKNIGMVFQKFALFPHKTVLENAEFGLEIQGIPKRERQEIAQKALDLVVMVDIQEGKSPEDAAKAWVGQNADKVASWLG